MLSPYEEKRAGQMAANQDVLQSLMATVEPLYSNESLDATANDDPAALQVSILSTLKLHDRQ
jgi:hypothetical protein